MSRTKNCIKEFRELILVLKTLPKNPYLHHYSLNKIIERRIRILVIYLVGTILHIALNFGIILVSLNRLNYSINFLILLGVTLKATYYQQQVILFFFAIIIIPFYILTLVSSESVQDRYNIVFLTPLSRQQIVIGLLSCRLILPFIGIILHLPITIICLSINSVKISYVLITTFTMLLTVLLFSIIAFRIALFDSNGNGGDMLSFLFVAIIMIMIAVITFSQCSIKKSEKINTVASVSPISILHNQNYQIFTKHFQFFILPNKVRKLYFTHRFGLKEVDSVVKLNESIGELAELIHSNVNNVLQSESNIKQLFEYYISTYNNNKERLRNEIDLKVEIDLKLKQLRADIQQDSQDNGINNPIYLFKNISQFATYAQSVGMDFEFTEKYLTRIKNEIGLLLPKILISKQPISLLDNSLFMGSSVRHVQIFWISLIYTVISELILISVGYYSIVRKIID